MTSAEFITSNNERRAGTPFERYLATLPAMKAGKVRKTLQMETRINGKGCIQRRAFAESHFGNVKIDRERSRLWTSENTFFPFEEITVSVVDYIEWLESNICQ